MKLTQLAGIQRGFTQRTLTEADLLNGWRMGTVKQIFVSRMDNMVTMEFPGLGLTGANKTHPVFITVPSGFRPAGFGNYGSIGVLMVGSTPVRVDKDFDRLSMEASGSVSGILMWRTVDSFPPPRFLESFWHGLRAWWGGRSETHTDHTQRHRLARPSALGHRWKCHLRNCSLRDGDRWWLGRRYLDSQNPGESNTRDLGSRSNIDHRDNRSSIGVPPEILPVPHRHIQGVVRGGACEHRRREGVYLLDYRRLYSFPHLFELRRHADVGRFRYIPHDVPRPAGVTVGGVL
ncbi:hypothetical protein CDES_07495 [Corynebacterium deserti GIMN1.010]|uniref:Uncharacterized protein n=1 Tax=Corynebacterium deserti GIMN1.010 TaxID=931089 RepID=A0A0M4CII0_9CORY|nr:hypothetical protein CDES_07495 [Corynebacterium deserti GIMN1.010]